ncbi:MAG TPA: energy transducer TonB [Acetobacteraceae bacterium]|nr:energy transducer TonB [Acetobacteraceae bacterium]
MNVVMGRCTNDLFCALASTGVVLRVPTDGLFVCSHCGRPLTEASERGWNRNLVIGAVVGGGLALTGIAMSGAAMMWTDRPSTPNVTWVAPAKRVAPPPVVTQRASPPVQSTTASAMNSAAPVPAMAGQPGVAAKPVAVAVAAPPPPTVVAVGSEGVAAGVRTVIMVPRSAGMVRFRASPKPDMDDPAIRAAQLAQANADAEKLRQAQAKMQAAQLAAAQLAAKQAHPAVATALAAPVAAPVVKASLTPPPPAHASLDRLFVARPISGGAPPFPRMVDDSTLHGGSVRVSCRIETDGAPDDCGIVGGTAEAPFRESVLRWLGSGRVRFAPILRGGVPTAETHQWSVQFNLEG